ncbi:MAG: hypothetical protein HQL84_04745 [Magnetococcales bacterium]|nr:hypothetical protein [Magnetococcales bacterium]
MVSISGNNTVYGRRSGFLSNSGTGCLALPAAGPSLCYNATINWTTTVKLDEEYLNFSLVGNYVGGAPYSLTCNIQFLDTSKTGTCGGAADYNRTTRTVVIRLGAYDVNSLPNSGLDIRYFAEDSAQVFTVNHSFSACSP